MPADPFAGSDKRHQLAPEGPCASRTATHPVLVVERDRVCRGQIGTEPACAHAQEEQVRRVWRVAALLGAVHLCAALQRTRRAVDRIKWLVLVLMCPSYPRDRARSVNPPHSKGIPAHLNDVEHGHDLRASEDFVSSRKERVKEPLGNHNFLARVGELFVHGVLVHARPFQQDRVRADLAQLYHDIF